VHFLHFACPGKKKITKKCKSGPESQNSSARKKNVFKKKVSEIGSRFYYVAKPEKKWFLFWEHPSRARVTWAGGESRRRPAISRQVNRPNMAMAHRPRHAKTGFGQSEIATYVLTDRPQRERESAIVASPLLGHGHGATKLSLAPGA
jgi:hypothetical protein